MKFVTFLFLVSLAISFVLLNPKIRSKTMKLFSGKDRSVLSRMDIRFEDQKYRIIKVFDFQKIFVEVYRHTMDGFILVDRQSLTDKRDAFYKFGENKYNLFLKDIDNDGDNEILIPTIDKNMKARLNIFDFDPSNERLSKISQH